MRPAGRISSRCWKPTRACSSQDNQLISQTFRPRVCSRIVAAEVRRRILARKTLPPSRRATAPLRRDGVRLVTSAATAFATMLEFTLPTFRTDEHDERHSGCTKKLLAQRTSFCIVTLLLKLNMEPKADIALIGLAVMGQNLILNMNDHGYTVVAFNRTLAKVDEFVAKEAKGTNVIGAHSIEEMVGLLKKPRRVMLMVKAGKHVEEFIESLLPHLEPGDIIIDGGNSLFEDTNRRVKY